MIRKNIICVACAFLVINSVTTVFSMDDDQRLPSPVAFMPSPVARQIGDRRGSFQNGSSDNIRRYVTSLSISTSAGFNNAGSLNGSPTGLPHSPVLRSPGGFRSRCSSGSSIGKFFKKDNWMPLSDDEPLTPMGSELQNYDKAVLVTFIGKYTSGRIPRDKPINGIKACLFHAEDIFDNSPVEGENVRLPQELGEISWNTDPQASIYTIQEIKIADGYEQFMDAIKEKLILFVQSESKKLGCTREASSSSNDN